MLEHHHTLNDLSNSLSLTLTWTTPLTNPHSEHPPASNDVHLLPQDDHLLQHRPALDFHLHRLQRRGRPGHRLLHRRRPARPGAHRRVRQQRRRRSAERRRRASGQRLARRAAHPGRNRRRRHDSALSGVLVRKSSWKKFQFTYLIGPFLSGGFFFFGTNGHKRVGGTRAHTQHQQHQLTTFNGLYYTPFASDLVGRQSLNHITSHIELGAAMRY